jgi:hypothetical protein
MIVYQNVAVEGFQMERRMHWLQLGGMEVGGHYMLEELKKRVLLF